MSCSCPDPASGFAFPPEEVAAAVERRGLLSVEIEFSLTCNFRCPYCYHAGVDEPADMTAREAEDVLLQAKELGARKVIILGGEPMLYPEIRERVAFIRGEGMAVELFTNGTGMTSENARFMFQRDVAVALKMNTFDRDLQNKLAGREDAYSIIQAALANLRAAGYPAPGKRLAVSTIICEQNIEELPALWRWLRREGIEPYVEMITPQGRAVGSEWLNASSERQHRLLEELARIDRDEFGLHWEPQPPLAGNSCLRHRFSCLITSSGTVMPCVGVTIPLGNVRQQPLREILAASEVLENLRDFPDHIKEPCASCEKAGGCYGCRGAAYQLTGDYLAADPLCWRNAGAAIERLPADAARYMPHRPPMLLVEKLLSAGERCARVRATVPEDGLLVGRDGLLEEAAHVEMVAQSAAALNGFHPGSRDGNGHGMLLGARGFEVLAPARAGDVLEISVRKVARFGEFGLVAGTVYRGGREIARGEVTVWQSSGEGENP